MSGWRRTIAEGPKDERRGHPRHHGPTEWLPSLFAGSRQHIARKALLNPDGTRFHDHKDFNWMALRAPLERRFVLERFLGSPFEWLPPQFGTQAWFLLRKLPQAGTI